MLARNILAAVAISLLPAPAARADEQLDRAVHLLATLHNGAFDGEGGEELREKVGAAAEVVTMRGLSGAVRLATEVDAVLDAEDREGRDLFLIAAGSILWSAGGLGQAERIARIWNEADLAVNPNASFYPAYEAAKLRQPEALPMMRAYLRCRAEPPPFLAKHSLPLTWPLNHQFVWGVYGPDGLPAFAEVLDTGTPDEVAAALLVLAPTQFRLALTRIRKLASSKEPKVRRAALQALGIYGHPDDSDTILAALDAEDPEDLFAATYAAYEMGDLRAVPQLVPLLETDNEQLLMEVLVALARLPTPKSLAALLGKDLSGLSWAGQIESMVDRLLDRVGTDRERFRALGPEEREAVCAKMRAAADNQYALREGDRTLTREELDAALTDWEERGRITGGEYGWMETRHVLAAAGMAGLSRLRRVRANLYRRLSDECLYEVRTLDLILSRVGRSRYRGRALDFLGEPK